MYNFVTTKIKNIHIAGGKSASSFMERCIAFIGDNAADCVKTNAFLNLPKEALIKLISSDFVSILWFELWLGLLKHIFCDTIFDKVLIINTSIVS